VTRLLLNCLLIALNVAKLSQALADLYNMQGDFALSELSIMGDKNLTELLAGFLEYC